MLLKFTCPCCGYKMLTQQPPGTFEICVICFWEDDGYQYDNPSEKGGANEMSLKQAQENFLVFGACDKGSVKFVRAPIKEDVKDENFIRYEQKRPH